MTRILIIDDDAGVREALARLVSRLGHEVEVAEDGLAGVRRLADFEADLVFTDINMPGMDGIEVIRALHEQHPGLPVVAISGGGLMDKDLLLDDAVALGAATALPKPFEMHEVEAVIEQLIGETGS